MNMWAFTFLALGVIMLGLIVVGLAKRVDSIERELRQVRIEQMSRWGMTLVLLLVATACQSPQVVSTGPKTHWRTVCDKLDEIEYCYYEVGTPDPAKQVIVFNHGLKDSAKLFLTPTSVPSSYPDWIKAMPMGTRILTISFGEGFLLTPGFSRTLEPKTATVTRYLEALGTLAAKFKLAPPYRLVGHSMGGANAAVLAQHAPELWSKIVLINPMLLRDSIDAFNVVQICPACMLIGYNYDNEAQWKMYRPEPIAKMPPAYVTACPLDIFLLYGGAEEWVTQSRKLGNSVKFVDKGCAILNAHWTWDVKGLVKFLESP